MAVEVSNRSYSFSSADVKGTLVFVEQKRTADFVASYISGLKIPTTSIHGDRFQSQREEALSDFRNRRMSILVATSVAARGLGKCLVYVRIYAVVRFTFPITCARLISLANIPPPHFWIRIPSRSLQQSGFMKQLKLIIWTCLNP